MKKKNFLRLMAITVATVQIFTVAGCDSKKANDNGKDDTSAEDTAKDTDADESAETTDEIVELRFMDVQAGDERNAFHQWVVDEFNKQNPNIHVTFEAIPWDNGYNKLVTLGAAGDLPDIYVNNTVWLSQFEEAGWMYDLDEYLQDGFSDKLVDYAKDTLIDYNIRQHYGTVGALPIGVVPQTFMVRTDWLEEAGMTLDDLKTWDGIFEAAEKMTDTSQNRYGFSFRGGQGGAAHMHYYVLATTRGVQYEEDGTSVYYRDEVKEAVAKYVSIYENGYGPDDSINWGFVETVQGFSSGLTGILYNNADVMASFGELDDDCWTSIVHPAADDGNIYCAGGPSLMSIAGTTEHPDEAWKFLEFMMSDEVNGELCRKFYYIPVTKSLAENPEFSEGKVAGFVDTINQPNFIATVDEYGYFSEASEFKTNTFDSEYQALLLGQQTVDEFCENIADWLTERQQAYMAENPDSVLPNARTK